MPASMTIASVSKRSVLTNPTRCKRFSVPVGATTVAWYGVRLFTDHWGQHHPGNDVADILAAEEEAGRRDPYRSVAALTHTIARVGEAPQ